MTVEIDDRKRTLQNGEAEAIDRNEAYKTFQQGTEDKT